MDEFEDQKKEILDKLESLKEKASKTGDLESKELLLRIFKQNKSILDKSESIANLVLESYELKEDTFELLKAIAKAQINILDKISKFEPSKTGDLEDLKSILIKHSEELEKIEGDLKVMEELKELILKISEGKEIPEIEEIKERLDRIYGYLERIASKLYENVEKEDSSKVIESINNLRIKLEEIESKIGNLEEKILKEEKDTGSLE
ncbi:MAG: hypothetical protein QW735_03455 [archaeon]